MYVYISNGEVIGPGIVENYLCIPNKEVNLNKFVALHQIVVAAEDALVPEGLTALYEAPTNRFGRWIRNDPLCRAVCGYLDHWLTRCSVYLLG